jgi:hypothetical protein
MGCRPCWPLADDVIEKALPLYQPQVMQTEAVA